MSAPTKALVLHIETDTRAAVSVRDPDTRLAEACGLAEAIALDLVHSRIVKLRKIIPATLVGVGILEQLKEIISETDATLLIVNHPLSPVQQRNLERALEVKVIDRTGLILEIFADRARTREGVLQVRLASLRFQKTRLVRAWTHLERQRGGHGFLGGPGETQIESDRRAIEAEIAICENQLAQVRKTRTLHRQSRKRRALPVIALVGYTNAGKSTLFNLLTQSDVFVANMLFATLDPALRQFTLPSGQEVIISDTVGFISDLPTVLVHAFHATLEEISEADLLLHVRDVSDPENIEQAQDVYNVLAELGVSADTTPILEVFNKIDLVPAEARFRDNLQAPMISCLTGQGLPALFSKIEEILFSEITYETLVLDFAHASARHELYRMKCVLSEVQDESGFVLKLRWTLKQRAQFSKVYKS